MAAMNGTPMNGTSMNGTHVESSVLPVHADSSHMFSMSATGDQHDDHAVPPEGSIPVHADPWPDVTRNELEAERMRLEAEIATAKSRAASARHRASARDTEMRDALRAEIAASKESLTAMEREHETTIAMVRGAAQAEVDRILAAAREVAAGMHTGDGDQEHEEVHHVE